MPLSWNEIKDRALTFSREWAGESREHAEDRSFWDGFFNVFGVTRRRVASFQEPVKKLGGAQGFIDLFWKGELIVEHKSRGKSLDKAYSQALDYFAGLAERDLPKRVLVSDFERIRLYELETGEQHEFPLAELHRHVGRFAFIAGYSTQKLAPEDPVNRRAAERMGRLHDALKAGGFTGHALEVLLVRLLFCLFAEDTGIFQPRKAFQDWVENRTAPDGGDLGPLLARFFQVLDTPESQRGHALDEQLAAFPYVNGKLFEERLPIADFDRATREALLDACALDWSQISPAIFGALFQSIMDAKARRNLGAHYTSERNILKLIRPLFLDELRAEFEKVKGNRSRLFEFHKKLRGLTFLDPACGCGNFLVVAYRELRLLELDVLRASRDTGGQRDLDTHWFTKLDVDQFHGIEIEEFPAQIAQVALWLTDHQMNLKVSEEFGLYFARIPLRTSPHIVHGNALRMDWNDVLPAERCSYVMGNPPFVGAKFLDDAQRADVAAVFAEIDNAGLLDFVAAWYVQAARYISPLPRAGEGSGVRVAFVSTNSICQGEQVGVLWSWLLARGMKIQFAHRTFQWSNEARGVAAVHCVIVGFGAQDRGDKRIFDYEDIRGEPRVLEARNINAYLVDAADVLLPNRSQPICPVPAIGIGNKPIDGGNYLFTAEQRDQFLQREPGAAPWFRRWLGSDEFINGWERWCLWLGDCPPATLRQMPEVMRRIEAVRNFRLASKSAPTRKLAGQATRFHVENIPHQPYLVVPKVSSERRLLIPIGFMQPDTLCSDLVFIVRDASLVHFGVLSSTLHMAWVRAVCGRLESRYRYSAGIVYNNFPWPVDATDTQRAAIETAAQGVLNARAQFPQSSLADLYDPLTMPPALVKAHQALDRAVDAAYVPSGGKKSWASDAERVAFLFELYQRLTSLLPGAGPARKAGRPRAAGSASRL
ncbi:MAG: class I SAM-dependent DNA methyltransferase [Immundisolibacter sp.]|uniref:class I SAM-dependent DNA methyltransferase n=1 Tax=Immundisolibacter sp. TaxID=1934948 RepID=UPI003D0BD774